MFRGQGMTGTGHLNCHKFKGHVHAGLAKGGAALGAGQIWLGLGVAGLAGNILPH